MCFGGMTTTEDRALVAGMGKGAWEPCSFYLFFLWLFCGKNEASRSKIARVRPISFVYLLCF